LDRHPSADYLHQKNSPDRRGRIPCDRAQRDSPHATVRADFFHYRARAKSAISLGRSGGGTMGMQNRFNCHEPHTTSGPHAPSSLPRVELEIVRGRARDKVRSVESRTYLIGSAVDCDLVLADVRFADVHAYLLRDPRGAIVRWLGCEPDLTVNGRLADSLVRLADGDRLRTGPYEFKVRIHWPAGVPRAATARASLRLFGLSEPEHRFSAS
jgi:hypothetical protein